MILTGPEITAAAQDGRLRITPFAPDQVNPNSYNVRLGPTLLTYTADVLDTRQPNPTTELLIGPDGYVLQPGELYLGHTLEEVGSDTFVPLLFGRSSVGRLGLFVEITAPIGDIGFHGQWTRQVSGRPAVHPVRPRPAQGPVATAQAHRHRRTPPAAPRLRRRPCPDPGTARPPSPRPRPWHRSVVRRSPRNQLGVLQETARAADAIVVPTAAMADRLLCLAPTTDRRKSETIPWGIPDHLLASPPQRRGHRPTSHLRLLYAGRHTAEKGIEALLHALPFTQAVELSVAPRHHSTPWLLCCDPSEPESATWAGSAVPNCGGPSPITTPW